MASVKFYYGDTRPSASAEWLGTLFFDTVKKQISRGCSQTENNTTTYYWEDYGGEVVILSGSTAFPSSGQREGVLYLKESTKEIRTWSGSDWVKFSEGIADPNETTTPSNNANKLVALGPDGKIPNLYIPPIALSEYISGTFADLAAVVAAFTAETATGELGDYVITQDNKTYILSSGNGKSTSDWTELKAIDTNTWRPIKVGSTTLNDTSSTVEFVGGTATSMVYDGTGTNKTITVGVKLASGSALTTDSNGNLEIEWQTYTPSQP